nr:MAG TPA: hypothetical protein [Caudoviricetes sp.]DAG16985.1 MAG TPA: hypothetical protein [Caudoviricetes sp.]DAI02218.1 MAG TPA: hypothetical protein [Caudoviricetes sp.]DAI99618.1 MAG TPA: hypothetical protein [Caudoviricetes sp.]DAR19743.1 MAG TPA: hypothetical protein [Caudoviricetes sp.]
MVHPFIRRISMFSICSISESAEVFNISTFF